MSLISVMIRDQTRNHMHQTAVVEPAIAKIMVMFNLRKLVNLNATMFFPLKVCRDQSDSEPD